MEKSQHSYPRHLGFIVDGNRRWAKNKNLPTLKGHQQGLKKVEMVIEELAKTPVKFASFYLFSTENWQRSPEEVNYLMNMAKNEILKLAKKMAKNNIKCLVLGSTEKIESQLLKKLHTAETLTQNSTGLTVGICFNYGGQQEIIDTAKKIATKSLPWDSQVFSQHLYQPEIPPIDMIIRTSGEQRLSGFMLWRSAYAELLFLSKHFPDLTPDDVQNILQTYQNRSRRFGK